MSRYIGQSGGTAKRIASNSDNSVLEAPLDGEQYVRKNGDWDLFEEDQFVKKTDLVGYIKTQESISIHVNNTNIQDTIDSLDKYISGEVEIIVDEEIDHTVYIQGFYGSGTFAFYGVTQVPFSHLEVKYNSIDLMIQNLNLVFLNIITSNSVFLHDLTCQTAGGSNTLIIANSDVFLGNCVIVGNTLLQGGAALNLDSNSVTFYGPILSTVGGATIVIKSSIDVDFALPQVSEEITVIDNRPDHAADTYLRVPGNEIVNTEYKAGYSVNDKQVYRKFLTGFITADSNTAADTTLIEGDLNFIRAEGWLLRGNAERLQGGAFYDPTLFSAFSSNEERIYIHSICPLTRDSADNGAYEITVYYTKN